MNTHRWVRTDEPKRFKCAECRATFSGEDWQLPLETCVRRVRPRLALVK